jgi:hypothetical protein
VRPATAVWIANFGLPTGSGWLRTSNLKAITRATRVRDVLSVDQGDSSLERGILRKGELWRSWRFEQERRP